MMENNQSMSTDKNYFRENYWRDVNRNDSTQDLSNYPVSASGWGSGSSSPSAASQVNGNVDKILYQNLVDIVPLVESLMVCSANKSYSHQATLVYTPKPPRDLSSKKMHERKVGKTPLTRCTTKQRTPRGLVDNWKSSNMDNEGHLLDEVPPGSSSSSVPDRENINSISKDETLSSGNNVQLLQFQNQIEDLGKENEELQKYKESSLNQIQMMQTKVEELQQQLQEKDNLIKSAQLQLCHKKNELADVKSYLKKAEEESKASNQKVQKLEEDLNGMRNQFTAFVSFLETLQEKSTIIKTEEVQSSEDLDVDPSSSTHDLHLNGYCKQPIEDEEYMASSEADKKEMEGMENARRMYIEAVVAAKNNPSEESLLLAADLRLQLQQFLLRPTLENILNEQLQEQALDFPAG